jgi:hypothetical protein
VFFGDQAFEAGIRPSENYYRNNTVVDAINSKIETVNLERVSNGLQCRFDRLYHRVSK